MNGSDSGFLRLRDVASLSSVIYDKQGNLFAVYTDTANTQHLIQFYDFPDEVAKPSSQTPGAFALSQNYPNPFNPSTTITYQLPVRVKVDVSVYNLLGQRIATLTNEVESAGVHLATWHPGGQSSGVYFVRIEAGSYSAVKKMVLLK